MTLLIGTHAAVEKSRHSSTALYTAILQTETAWSHGGCRRCSRSPDSEWNTADSGSSASPARSGSTLGSARGFSRNPCSSKCSNLPSSSYLLRQKGLIEWPQDVLRDNRDFLLPRLSNAISRSLSMKVFEWMRLRRPPPSKTPVVALTTVLP